MSKSKSKLLRWLTKFEKTSREKGMAGWLIKRGLAKGKGTANVELLLVSVFFFAMSKLIFVFVII